MKSIWILAAAGEELESPMSSNAGGEEATTSTTQADGTTQQEGAEGGQTTPGFNPMQFLLIGILVFFVFMMFRGPKKKQQQHKKMIESLKKNDRVRTIGGILGTVVDISDNEVRLKIDESNNTKMWFVTGAIAEVLQNNE